MKRTAMIMGITLVAAAAPVAIASAHNGDANHGSATAAAAKAKAKPAAKSKATRPVLTLVRACVTSDAVTSGEGAAAVTTLGARVLSSNRHAKAAGLKRGVDFTAKLDGSRITLVGAARTQPGTTVKLPRLGTFENLDTGDVITLRVRAPRATPWAALPAYTRVVDHGAIRPAVCPPAAPAQAPQS